MASVDPKLLLKEMAGFAAAYADDPDEDKALAAGGECAQRVNDMPKVEDLINRIMEEAEDTLKNVPARVLA